MKALVTGATGFIGARLVEALQRRGDSVAVVVRHAIASSGARVYIADVTKPETLAGTCVGIDVVFHLAGYAHADNANDPSAADIHQRVTVDGTRALLQNARLAGVKRFVFVSSVKAMGEGGPTCLDEQSRPRPETAYGWAKRAAEELVTTAGRTGIESTILRLPLVYGNTLKGNITRMVRAIDQGRFPPLPALKNKRSMVHVDDVVQALLLAGDRDDAVGKTYIVTDGRTYSTYDLYASIRRALGRSVPSWSVPMAILKLGAKFGDAIGALRRKPFPLNSSALEKLTASAWYSSDKLSRELGFQPQWSFETALPEIVSFYRRYRDDVS